MVMQLNVTGDSLFGDTVGFGGINSPDPSLLWPSNSSEDVIRRHLAAILLEDPDHRLRVAHLEPLLHIRMASQPACSSGRLQALLTDPATARIFPVDFSNTRATGWRSRVVFLDLPQLLKEAGAAKQQQLGSGAAVAGDMQCIYADGNDSVLQAGKAGLGGRLPSSSGGAASGSLPSPQHHHSVQGQGPLGLEAIFAASPALGSISGGGGGAGAQRCISGSVGGAAGGSYGTAGSMGGEPRISLFGSSFEVPHAIASCWAGSSCGSGVGSMPGAAPTAAAPGAHNNGSLSTGGKEPLLPGAGNEAGSGGSSTASGSSTRSVNAASRAAQAAASRLRKASNTPDGLECGMDGAGNELPAACSAGGLSGIDVCTPKSAGAGVASGEASTSPAASSAAEEDVEYCEAQLVFGVTGSGSMPTSNGIGSMSTGSGAGVTSNAGLDAAAAAAAAAAAEAAADAEYLAQVAAANAGMNRGDGAPVEGVDWARVAAMQRQEQQGIGGQFGQLHSHQAPMFGRDDVSDYLPGSSAPAGLQGRQYLQQQQHAAALAATAQQHAYASSLAAARRMLLDQAGYRDVDPLAPSPLFSPPQQGFSLGSAPSDCVHDLFLQAEHAAMFGAGGAAAAAVAAAAAGAAGFNCIGAGTTAAQLAESVLLEGDGHAMGSQQVQRGLHSGSYGSSSGGAGWRTSPNALAGHFGALQQQHQHQRMLHRSSDAAVDAVSFRSDQVREQGAVGARSGSSGSARDAAAAAGKPMSFAAAAAAAPAGPGAAAAAESESSTSGAGGALSTPRLTGWASIAAKEPKPSPGTPSATAAASGVGSVASGSLGGAAAGMWANGRPQSGAGSSAASVAAGKAAGGVASAGEAGRSLGRLPQCVRAEVQGLIGQFNGVLKAEDFDEGVVHQLNAKRSEEEAVAAVRHIAHYDLANIQHMAAYLNHLVKHYNHGAAAAAAAAAAADGMPHGTGGAAGLAAAGPGGAARVGSAGGVSGGGQLGQGGSSLGSTIGSSRGGGGAGASAPAAAGGNLGAFGGQIRLASVPVSTKSMLQKLPLKVFKQLEQLVAGCVYLEWRHFDAGVVKVLAQLSKLCEADVFEELELLAATDLSNVEYMPAYLNKRLNNKLWSRRKADGHVPSG